SRSCSRSRRCSAPVRISRCAPALYPGAMTTPSLRTRIQHRLIRALGGEATPSGQPGTTALVISGGGARSSFELGALQYLYEQGGIAPNIITGTSAGSILAAVIAQYQGPQSQLQAVRQLRSLWLAMEDSSDMFTELPWFTKLNEHMPTWRKVMALRNRSRHRPHRSRSRRPGSDSPPDHDTRTHESARTRDDGAPDHAPPDHGLARPRTNVLGALRPLRAAGRTRPDRALLLPGADQDRAAFRPAPIVQRLTDPDLFVPAIVAGSGISLRIATVALETGELRYVDEAGRLRDREDRLLPDHEPVDLIQAVLASCAIPGVFPPVRLGQEHYVDGGARQSLPLDVATRNLGAQRCYAVVASPLGLARSESFAEKDMLEIVLRSGFGIMTDEILTDEVRRAREIGATVIEPELDIHDILTVDPGLTLIAMDYGWTRAAEECTGASAEMRRRTRAGHELRRAIWSAADPPFRPAHASEGTEGRARTGTPTAAVAEGRTRVGAPATAQQTREALDQIGELKVQLRHLVTEAGPALLPPDAPRWWRDFEPHPYPIHAE